MATINKPLYDQLQNLISEGIESGESVLLVDDVWQQVKKRQKNDEYDGDKLPGNLGAADLAELEPVEKITPEERIRILRGEWD